MFSKSRLFFLSLAFLSTSLGAVSLAADLSPQPKGPPVPKDRLAIVLTEKAALYELRAAFNVISRDDIPALLSQDAKTLSNSTYLEEQRNFVRQDLLAEGSYYIVSLQYLVESGGADWPQDKASAVYEKDAEVKLEALKQRWLAELQSDGEDLVAILGDVDMVNAWTEGQPAASGDLSHFADVPDLVAAAVTQVTSKN